MTLKEKNKDLFRLTEDNLNKIRYIKLDKKASYSEKDLEKKAVNNGDMYAELGTFETIKFYSFGFYDVLKCMRKKINTSFTNREHFLIAYPFEKSRATLKVEQWFGILPLSLERKYSNVLKEEEIDDPFFYNGELQEKMPFAGVLLISLGETFNNSLLEFKELLKQYVNVIDKIFKEDNKKKYKEFEEYIYIAEIYYSLNCSDLCLVIRTNGLPFIHFMNSVLNKKAADEKIEINTTVIFSVQDNASIENLDNIAEMNKNVKFIVRSNIKYNGTEPRSSYSVNGVGKYVTELDYKDYVRCLSGLISYKVNNEDIQDEFIKSICHEREWFDGRVDSSIYRNLKLQEATHKWINNIYDKITSIGEMVKNIFQNNSNSVNMYDEMLLQEFSFIKDLVYTYSDLWYQKASISGFVFFSQIYIALDGISFMLEEVGKDSIVNNNIPESIEEILKVIHDISFDLNGYNKQFQYLNQDSVNYPSYEIQSKVNAEKYMSAYCSFLHKFFALYYEKKDGSENIVQNFPLALVDINQREIIAKLFFRNVYNIFTKDDNDKKYRRGLFSVHFPSSRYFSDLWISLPLLMHEVSHTQHYGETEKRNLAVIYNIDRFFSEKITNTMLIFINNGEYSNSSIFLSNEISTKVVYEAIKSAFIIYNEDKANNEEYLRYGYTELIDYYKEFYYSLFNDFNEIKEDSISLITDGKAKEDFDFIMDLIGFQKMCFPYVGKIKSLSAFQYLVNVLYLEFHYDFYERYKNEYDNDFINELIFDMNDCRNDFEKEMYEETLERFNKNIKAHNTETEDSYVYVIFSVIVATGMSVVFEKYKKEFHNYDNEEEFNYMYYEQLFPDIYTFNVQKYVEMLLDTYSKYITMGKQKTEHEKHMLSNMLKEYYQLVVCIKNIIQFMCNRGAEVNKKLNMTNVFLEKIHDKSVSYVNNIENNEDLKIIFSEINRGQITQMGFFEDGDTIIKELFTKVFTVWKRKYIEDIIDDRSLLFQEVYADCGMCKAMGFDAFGYCMFAVSIHNIVGDLRVSGIDANFLADRLCSVLQIYFSDINDEYKSNTFCNKLFDTRMINAICDMLYLVKKNTGIEELKSNIEEINLQKLLNKDFDSIRKDDFRKWREVINKIIVIIDKEYSGSVKEITNADRIIVARNYLYKVNSILGIFIKQDIWTNIRVNNFNGYFKYLSDKMEGKKWIEIVRNDECIKEIGQFYNVDFPNDESNKFEWHYKLYTNGFIKQCNFIFNNYCEYRSAFGGILNEVNSSQDSAYPDIGEWFDILDNYYIKKEG